MVIYYNFITLHCGPCLSLSYNVIIQISLTMDLFYCKFCKLVLIKENITFNKNNDVVDKNEKVK